MIQQRARNLRTLYKSWTPEVLIKRPRIHTLLKKDHDSVGQAIEIILLDLRDHFKVTERMEEKDIFNTVDAILDRFPSLSVEDIFVFHKKAFTGEFVGKGLFNRFDGGVVCDWLAMYEDIYVTDSREAYHHELKLDADKAMQEEWDLAVQKGKKHGFDLNVKKRAVEKKIEDMEKTDWFKEYTENMDKVNKDYKKGDSLLEKAIAVVHDMFRYKLYEYNKLKGELSKLDALFSASTKDSKKQSYKGK